MARQARLAVPGHPHHLLIRGNNQQPIFVDDQDRQRLLENLAEALRALPLALHAYVLMPNHLHLLATPQGGRHARPHRAKPGPALCGLFQCTPSTQRHAVGGRYRAHVVGGADEVLRCMRFIESNPQRKGLVVSPLEPAWSSLPHHLGALRDPLITEPAAYWQLGNTPVRTRGAYKAWMEQGSALNEAARIRFRLVGWPSAWQRRVCGRA
jgi:putative transposase